MENIILMRVFQLKYYNNNNNPLQEIVLPGLVG